MKYFALIALSLINICSCTNNRESFVSQSRKSPQRCLENYSYNISLPLADRINAAPDFLINYLNVMDNTTGYSSYTITSTEKNLFKEYICYLPSKYLDCMKQKLIGVYFINNFMGGGMSDFVFANSGDMYLILLLNPQVLKQSLSDWISYRDNSFFDCSDNIKITNNLGKNYKGLLHSLIHESCHIYDYFNQVTPYIHPSFQQTTFTKKSTTFTSKIWKNYNVPYKKYDYPLRETLIPYGLGNKQSSTEIISIYNSLTNGPFLSIYGSQSWAEDFAETFTWFYVNNYFDIRYNIEVQANDSINKYSFIDNPIAKKRYSQLSRIVL